MAMGNMHRNGEVERASLQSDITAIPNM